MGGFSRLLCRLSITTMITLMGRGRLSGNLIMGPEASGASMGFGQTPQAR
jgi:hypothetical protein